MSAHKSKMHRCHCQDCVKHPYSQAAKKHRAINNLLAGLDEKSRRQCVGALALQRGWGGISALHLITGLSRKTIQRGRDEILRQDARQTSVGVRHPGGGRPTVEKNIRTS